MTPKPERPSFQECLLLDAFTAIAIHAFYKRFQVDPSNVLLSFILLGVLPMVPLTFFRFHFESIIISSAFTYALCYMLVFISIGLYRLSPWHPLAKYPGPTLAKISMLWRVWIVWKGKQHLYFQNAHKKYGPYVRIGPNELSFSDISTIPKIMGPNGLGKGPMWKARAPPGAYPSLISLSDRNEHARRRKLWTRGLNTQSIKEYEPLLIKRSLQLAEGLEKVSMSRQAVDLARWLKYFSFDFMGDMAFGGGFELMKEGDKNGIYALMEKSFFAGSLIHFLPWVNRTIFKLPNLHQSFKKFFNFALNRAALRRKQGSVSKDLFHHLIDEDGHEREPPSDKQIISDAVLTIIAGSHSISAVIANVFYYILTHPVEFAALRDEVDQVFPVREGNPFDTSKLAEMTRLNAIINETLRIQAPSPVGTQRATSAFEGKMIGHCYVPKSTVLYCPIYTIQHDTRYFSKADTFWSDRWLIAKSDPSHQPAGFIHNPSAFIPFSYGPADCAGKNLAYMELRMVIALLVQRFDMRLEDGFDPLRDWEDKLEDRFVLTLGNLPVVLNPRA